MEKEELVIKDRLQNLIGRMKELGYKEHWIRLTVEYVNQLQGKGMLGVDKFVRRLERCTKGNDKREYWDVLMEGRFAAILASNNFSGIEVEYSSKGPDIKAEWNGNTIYFEVTRKRSKVDEWAEQPEDLELPSSKPEDIITIIQGKMGQLQSGEINIVVFWSSTLAVLEPDMKEAFRFIRQEINQNPQTYEKLSGILFTEDGGTDVVTMKQFYLFKNEKASKPIGTRLGRKLESLHERDLNELRREVEALTATLKRIRGH